MTVSVLCVCFRRLVETRFFREQYGEEPLDSDKRLNRSLEGRMPLLDWFAFMSSADVPAVQGEHTAVNALHNYTLRALEEVSEVLHRFDPSACAPLRKNDKFSYPDMQVRHMEASTCVYPHRHLHLAINPALPLPSASCSCPTHNLLLRVWSHRFSCTFPPSESFLITAMLGHCRRRLPRFTRL